MVKPLQPWHDYSDGAGLTEEQYAAKVLPQMEAARKINPDIYIVTDAVQHMPHGVLDVAKLKLDGCNFAPYKAFGIRGCGYAYVSVVHANVCPWGRSVGSGPLGL